MDHDSATIRQRLVPIREARRVAAPEELKLESLYPEAWLLASIGDQQTALDWLAPTLDAQPRSSTGPHYLILIFCPATSENWSRFGFSSWSLATETPTFCEIDPSVSPVFTM